MIPELGNFALALACALAFAQAVIGIYGAHRRDMRLMAATPGLALGQLLALVLAAGALVWASVANDFSVINVAENSAIAKPLLYKISGTWGNHEGSILLWGLIFGHLRRVGFGFWAQSAECFAGAGAGRVGRDIGGVPAVLFDDIQSVFPGISGAA